jgi:type IV pilus assembly protein PilV
MLNKPHRTGACSRGRQGGALLIEVLVAVLLLAFALLGLASMQARASSIEFEALQRSQALVLVEDMVSRINLNRANSGDYVSAGLLGAGAVADCSGLVGAARDLCEWSNLIRGSTETNGGARVGSMLAARGCITRAAATTHLFVVSVTWQGVVPTGAPSGPCGANDATYPDPALRRMVSSTVCVALLRDTDPAPVVARC